MVTSPPRPEARRARGRRAHSLILTLDRYVRVMVVAIMVVIAFGAGFGVNLFAHGYTSVGAQTKQTGLESTDTFSVLSDTYDVIREDYVMSDDITDDQLIYGAATGMVEALGDTGHSRFMNPDDAQRFIESSNGELVGIGIQVDTQQLPLRIIMPIQNSPAFKAGIKSGDVILTIDGTDVSQGEDPQAAVDLLRGREGTDVVLELRHEGDAESYEVTITRERITVNPVSWAMMPEGVLWIRIDGFDTGAGDEVAKALQAGIDQNAKGVILDLRANPGGLVDEANKVNAQFQKRGSLLYTEQEKNGDKNDIKVDAPGGLWLDKPLVVLIDKDSASASEVTASSIHDNKRAPLIGQVTAGTGTVLHGVTLDDGSMVLIGFALWLRPDGETIWHKGVAPDTEVANEPGVQLSLPYSFDNNEMTAEQYSSLQDDQLIAGYDEVIQQIAGN